MGKSGRFPQETELQQSCASQPKNETVENKSNDSRWALSMRTNRVIRAEL